MDDLYSSLLPRRRVLEFGLQRALNMSACYLNPEIPRGLIGNAPAAEYGYGFANQGWETVLARDISMFSTVAAVGAFDAFLKGLVADLVCESIWDNSFTAEMENSLKHSLPQTPRKDALKKMSELEEAIKNDRELGRDTIYAQGMIRTVVDKLLARVNFQGRYAVESLAENLVGVNLADSLYEWMRSAELLGPNSGFSEPMNKAEAENVIETALSAFGECSDDRHIYVHRLGADLLAPGGDFESRFFKNYFDTRDYYSILLLADLLLRQIVPGHRSDTDYTEYVRNARL